MKITALKVVYWDDGFGIKKGKVKRIWEDHAEIQAENGLTYMLATAKLSTVPLQKTASSGKRMIISERQNGKQE